jgi:hypothetical protein
MSKTPSPRQIERNAVTENGPVRPRISTLIAAMVIVTGTFAIAWQSNDRSPLAPIVLQEADKVERGEKRSDVSEHSTNSKNDDTGDSANVNPSPEILLSDVQKTYLSTFNWEAWVGHGKGIWVSVDEQMLRLIEDNTIRLELPCATASKGTGSQLRSYKTPLGWHKISEKIGENAPWGQVFRERRATKEVWRPGQDSKSDLVLSRILWLSGQEPGKNLGGTVDSHNRFIYIHGTNGEDLIGTPSSHGCVRLRNDDVITLFDRADVDTPVLISERVAR